MIRNSSIIIILIAFNIPFTGNYKHSDEADYDCDDLNQVHALFEKAEGKKRDPERICRPEDHNERDRGHRRCYVDYQKVNLANDHAPEKGLLFGHGELLDWVYPSDRAPDDCYCYREEVPKKVEISRVKTFLSNDSIGAGHTGSANGKQIHRYDSQEFAIFVFGLSFKLLVGLFL